MAAPIIKLKRSAVAGKRPTLANLPLGEIALNTYDGKLFVRQDTSGVGIATTVRTVNPWSENFISGGEHSIYYTGGDVGVGTDNPTAKLDVDGTVNVSGDANISGVSTLSGNVNLTGNITSNVTIVSTDAGSSAAPEFKLYRNSASPADADYLGQIKFAGESDTGVERNYAKITGKIGDASNGTEDGIIEIAHIKAGSQNISGRWNSTTLQLLNGTSFSVAGDSTFTGNILANSDSTVDIGTNSTRFANVYADTYYGDGSNLTGITAAAAVGVQTSGGYVGSGVTAFSFEGSAVGNVTVPSSGISTININATTALSRTVTNVTPTQDQTDFTVSYQVGFIDVYLNGVLLSGSDFTATNGTSVSISTSLSTTDNVDFIAYEGVSAGVVDGINRWTSVGSSIYNNNSGNVGIGTDNPQDKLHILDSTHEIKFGNVADGPSNGTTDAGVLFKTSTGQLGGMFTELDGKILSYGTNISQLESTGYDSARSGGIFRFDTRTDAEYTGSSILAKHCFVIKGREEGQTSEYSAFGIDLNTGDTLLCPEQGNVGVGTDSPVTPLEVQADNLPVTIRRNSDAGDLIWFRNNNFYNAIGGDDGDLYFKTNGTNYANIRLRITSTGDVGIGTNVPGSRLHVFSSEPEVILAERSNNNNVAIQYTNTEGSMYAGLTSNAESWAVDDDNNLGAAPMFCVLRSNGNVGINSSIPGEALDVNGNVKAVDFNSTSDIKLKDKVRKISKPLSKLNKIRGVSFEWKETKQKSMGVVAQEVEKVLPDLVRGDETKTVNYNGLIGLLIECVKEQQIRIDQLEQKLGQL